MSERTSAKNDVVQLKNAITNYHLEYGYFPNVAENNRVDSDDANAKLIEILSGVNEKENPRKIQFIDVQKASKSRGRFRSGIDPRTGAWKDPWGNCYLVRIRTVSKPVLRSPYPDDEISPGVTCLVWSLGDDGVQGDSVGGDDVASWR